MSVERIRAALVQAYTEVVNVPTEYDNAVFRAPNGVWARLHFSPNTPLPVTCGADGEDEVTGYVQVTCCCPQGNGEQPALDVVNELLNTFRAGNRFSYLGQQVMVTSCGRAPGFSEGNWYKIPVSIFFLAYFNRNKPTFPWVSLAALAASALALHNMVHETLPNQT